MSLPIEWWDRIAKMARPALVQTLVEEAELRLKRDNELERTRGDYNDLNNKVKGLENEVSHLKREYENRVLIAATMDEASRAARTMGLTGQRTIVLTDGRYADTSLRGIRLRAHQVFLVPGWQRGAHANNVKDSLRICGVDYMCCSYAPSPEIEHMETTRYGRYDSGYQLNQQNYYYDAQSDSYRARDKYYFLAQPQKTHTFPNKFDYYDTKLVVTGETFKQMKKKSWLWLDNLIDDGDKDE